MMMCGTNLVLIHAFAGPVFGSRQDDPSWAYFLTLGKVEGNSSCLACLPGPSCFLDKANRHLLAQLGCCEGED